MKTLARFSRAINLLNEYVGRGTAWVAVTMVLVQFVVVILRYVFSWGSIPLQESIWYMHGILFMLGAGYTLLHGGHVRVDILYREMPPRRKAQVDLWGVLLFLFPVFGMAWAVSWHYVLNSWRILEGSIETSGLPLIFLLKTVIWAFILLVALQGLSMVIQSLLVLKGMEPERAATEAGIFEG